MPEFKPQSYGQTISGMTEVREAVETVDGNKVKTEKYSEASPVEVSVEGMLLKSGEPREGLPILSRLFRYFHGQLQSETASRAAHLLHAARRPIRSIEELTNIWTLESQLTWIVPDLLAEGSVNLISSASGTGKTWLSYFLAGAVAHGREIFGKQVAQRKVLYLDGENPACLVKQRLHDLGIKETPDLHIWGGWEREPAGGPDHPIIIEYARSHQPLLIWDSLVEFHDGEEHSSTDTRRFMKKFRHLANLGATVVILHHTGKATTAQQYRGSSDIEAAVDMAFKLDVAAGGKKTTLDTLTLAPFKNRLALVPTRTLRYVKGSGFELSGDCPQPADEATGDVEVIRGIVKESPGLIKTDVVGRAMARGIAKHTAAAIVNRENIFAIRRGTANSQHVYLVEDAPAEEEPEAA